MLSLLQLFLRSHELQKVCEYNTPTVAAISQVQHFMQILIGKTLT